MSASPIIIALVAVLTLGFEAMVFEDQLASRSAFHKLDTPSCDGGSGFFDALERIACYVGAAFVFVLNIFVVIGNFIAFLGNAVSFNVDGAPWYIRLGFGTFFAGSLTFATVSLIRGTSA